LKFFNWVKNKFSKTIKLNDPYLLEWLGIDSNLPRDKLSEATYFVCLKVLAESLGKIPLKMYQDTEKGKVKSNLAKEYECLRLRPNEYMNSTIFWSTVEMNRNHYGNAYVWCRHDGSRVKDLWIMPSEDVRIIVDDQGIFGKSGNLYYEYTDKKTGQQLTISNDYIMHFKTSMTFDGITGLAVRDILKHTLQGSMSGQRFMNNLYDSGLTGRAVLEYTGDLSKEAKERVRKGMEDFASGEKNAGRIIPVPFGMKLVPLNIKLTDSQFFELRKYSALQIAAAFGIKPPHINDYDKSSYATNEAQNLAFYVDTLLYILRQYEEEITYKCMKAKDLKDGHFWKFNVNVILRADIKAQIEALSKGVNNMIYMPDEARDYLDMPTAEGGDRLYGNGNYLPATMLGKQYEKLNGGESSE